MTASSNHNNKTILYSYSSFTKLSSYDSLVRLVFGVLFLNIGRVVSQAHILDSSYKLTGLDGFYFKELYYPVNSYFAF